jgi:phosphopentomutase
VTQNAIGRRESFADIGASVLTHLGVPTKGKGTPWL